MGNLRDGSARDPRDNTVVKKPHAKRIHSWRHQLAVDSAIDAYVDWRDECRAVWDTYRRWTSAPVAHAGRAFEGYSAALEREERAADVYAAQIRRVRDVIRTEHGHAGGLTQAPPEALRQTPHGP
jgi:hypothetical protein